MLIRTMYYLPQVLAREWKTTASIQRHSLAEARSLLRDVLRTNVFYKKKLEHITIEEIQSCEDLSVIPFTTKDELRRGFPDVISKGYTPEGCIHESTSGSTGDVLNIYHDPAAYSFYDAVSLREYMGLNLWPWYRMSYIRFEQQPARIFEYLGILRKRYIPVAVPAEEQLRLVQNHNPDVASGYPSSLYEIARLYRENPGSLRLKMVLSNSELLTESTREYLESTFNCPVYDDYSSFELHNIGAECALKSMHIHIDNNIVEIIKDGEQAAPGEVGEIVVTNIRNRAMPFIRYRTGDYGALDEEPCPCGRGLPVFKSIEGRKDEYLVLPSGGHVSPRVFDPLDLIFHLYVSKFQIIQKKKDEFLIKVVREANYHDDVTKTLVREAKRCFPEPIEVEVMPVEDISRTGRGKLRAVLCEVNS
ncbi:MAG: phenylacetate--CoA ligase family protein [Theionarchaea archaeon]|nr:phenylacetate--CoA ligase family protein [Theionarchaea archaeon]MBU7001010.1 phenylacetate--CoA ligase family protein [Theionarchaea archaeon]MBU7020499.1 phenylacetate--CoA ligase family protein [Theionarchaea archaeon]MBU7034458.1 phenylacetate--CoA ligase family protein [Theionarchaea archaeon]MBU7039793.1 phenylacetate--CoA ligase family protein [Theionarchaea archaeon]